MAIAAALGACGSDDQPTLAVPPSTSSTATTTPGAPDPAPSDCDPAQATPPAEARLDLSIGDIGTLTAGAPAIIPLEVRNEAAQPATLVFSSGQDGDVVLRQGARVFWRWSDGRAFTEVLRCQVVPPAGAARYELATDDLDVEPGEYEMEVTVAARPEIQPARRPVTVGD